MLCCCLCCVFIVLLFVLCFGCCLCCCDFAVVLWCCDVVVVLWRYRAIGLFGALMGGGCKFHATEHPHYACYLHSSSFHSSSMHTSYLIIHLHHSIPVQPTAHLIFPPDFSLITIHPPSLLIPQSTHPPFSPPFPPTTPSSTTPLPLTQ